MRHFRLTGQATVAIVLMIHSDTTSPGWRIVIASFGLKHGYAQPMDVRRRDVAVSFLGYPHCRLGPGDRHGSLNGPFVTNHNRDRGC